MSDKHIKTLLDSIQVSQLNPVEIRQIEEHSKVCSDCEAAWNAARLAHLLVAVRLEESQKHEPPPFFTSRVMAQVRTLGKNGQASMLVKWWKTSLGLASLLALIAVVTSGVVSMVGADDREAANQSQLFPEEALLLNHKISYNLSEDEAFHAVYNSQNEVKKDDWRK